MSILIDARTAALNTLSEQCIKAARCYREAAGAAESEGLRSRLEALHAEREDFAETVDRLIAHEMDTLPKAVDPEQLGLGELVLKTAAMLADDTASRLVAGCVDADRAILDTLDDEALTEDTLPPRLGTCLEVIRGAVRRAVEDLA
ncbi:MAG: hypothetical protein U5S82_15305 [Gammaproteobacteria bacterium]|nr:hypothetical protein [Gammaproteobacteria bacterium]